MAKLRSADDFINAIKEVSPLLKNLRVSSIELDKEQKGITYNFICDQTIPQEVKEQVIDVAVKHTPPAFSHISANFSKIVSDTALVNISIFNYLKDNFPSISIFLKPTDVLSVMAGDVVKFTLRLTKDGADYVAKNGTIKKVTDYLSKKFCSEFSGGTEIKEQEETINLLSEETFKVQLEKIEHRTIKVKDVVVIDDENMGDLAVYIEDAKEGEVTVCGTVTEITERQTKSENPKPYFIIHIDDTTGRTSGIYFSRKSTCQRIRDIKIGDDVIMRGSIENRDGRKSFKIDKINRCTFPKDFVKKDKFKKPVPDKYSLIFPEPVTTVKMSSVFDLDEKIPNSLMENEYVVFDIETTGLDLMSNGITEIGAVKVKEGKKVEQFTTLIKPDYHIDAENEQLTGISEEMVKNSPKISAVIPDFMKFIDGAILVAHNAQFDMGFIRRFANAEEFEVKNKVLDTMNLARETVPSLKRVGLKEVAEHFNVEFRHHRALNDAHATADVFIEMMKIKG